MRSFKSADALEEFKYAVRYWSCRMEPEDWALALSYAKDFVAHEPPKTRMPRERR